jgi:hypothetical protein
MTRHDIFILHVSVLSKIDKEHKMPAVILYFTFWVGLGYFQNHFGG